MNDHPPLNTPLSAFTPAMLDALPVGSAFGNGLASHGSVVKFTRGWTFGTVDDPAAGFEDMGSAWDMTRPLIRVGPEQASDPAPSATLPDPWPNMLVEVQADSADEWDRGAIRRAYRARHGSLYVHVEGLENPVQWHPDEIREVRTPDGVTLWKRPAAKVTT